MTLGVRVRFWKGAWWIFVTHRGLRRAKRVGDRRAAEEVASKLRARLQLGDLSVFEPERDIPTLEVYAERWLETYVAIHCKPRTHDLYSFLCRRHLFPAMGTVHFPDVTREKVQALVADKIRGGMKRTTALKVAALLREILNHAVEDRHIAANPATRIGRFYRGHTEEEARPRVDPFTEGELTQLLAACQRWFPEWLALVAPPAWTCRRHGEILGPQWGHSGIARERIEVQRT